MLARQTAHNVPAARSLKKAAQLVIAGSITALGSLLPAHAPQHVGHRKADSSSRGCAVFVLGALVPS